MSPGLTNHVEISSRVSGISHIDIPTFSMGPVEGNFSIICPTPGAQLHMGSLQPRPMT